ncbi:hypothetical protein [Mariniradius sediminis]|uniref:DUF559 domain-containing protein n=1 Tax=Mariniradius sediminis TaxID=2909237 RepID=A0ABS9BX35_9BACT|nr:hypothetical protein [Mariniradius sediminis]MCF1752620.1 hypothetical protein [Mariniradius sediminis]
MRYNILIPDQSYPLVLLPKVVENYLSNEITLLDLCDEANLTYPEAIEKAHSIDVYYDIDVANFKQSKIEKKSFRTLEQIENLKHDSIDYELENHDFYFGKLKLPKKPKFHEEIREKPKIDFLGILGELLVVIFIFSILGIILGLFSGAGLLIKEIAEFLNVPFLLVAFIAIFASSIFYFVYHLLNGNNDIMISSSYTVLVGSEDERVSKLNEYKDSIYKLFENASKELAIERNMIETSIETQREEIQKGILKKRLENYYLGIEQAKSSKRGKTEFFFLQFLHETFRSNVKIDVAPVMKKAFLPDFVIICSDLGLYVDVEIDEPYSLESGDIIHHDRSRDSVRNQFFIDHNWIVIRFSERQIVENPLECVSFITNVLSALGKKEKYIETNIKQEPLWTYEQVNLMRFRDERRKYLGLLNN